MKLIEKPYRSTTTPKTTTTMETAKKAQILPAILLIKSKKEDMDFSIFIYYSPYYIEIKYQQMN
jgi:hypothetical protein